jgi:hypothetical protein
MLNRFSSENKKASTLLELYNLSREQLKEIEKETRNMKPRFNCGEFFCLRKDIKQDEYLIPQNTVCWVEDIKILLNKKELLSPPK